MPSAALLGMVGDFSAYLDEAEAEAKVMAIRRSRRPAGRSARPNRSRARVDRTLAAAKRRPKRPSARKRSGKRRGAISDSVTATLAAPTAEPLRAAIAERYSRSLAFGTLPRARFWEDAPDGCRSLAAPIKSDFGTNPPGM